MCVHAAEMTEYNNPIVWVSPGGFFEVSGAFFSYTEYAPEQNTLFANKSRNSGKLYLEFNCGGNLSESHYYFGFVSEAHGRSRTGPMPGFSLYSWALSTNGGDAYHDSTSIDLGFPFSLLGTNTEIGFYYNYSSQFLRDGGIMRWAVDFDTGKMWAGYYDYENSHDVWDGNPAAGTDPTYTFTPNTPLVPAIGIDFWNGVLQSTAWGGLSAHRGNYRATPPSGFDYWEEFANQTEVLADTPAGYWMAGPNSGRWISNSIGMTPGEADSSGNQRYADHYGLQSYAELTEVVRVMFPAQTPRAWYSTAINIASTYPCSLAGGSSRTFDLTIEITGAGATNAAGWKGGSGILCNYTNGANRGAFTTSDRWFGLSLRDRKLIFGVGASEVTSSADLANGLYYIACVLDVTAGTLTLFINGAQDAQTTGYTSGGQAASYIAVGAIRPNATNGNFPGYIRDVAYYHSALSSTRIAAHYAHLQVAPMPNPIGSLIDGRTARFPYFAI